VIDGALAGKDYLGREIQRIEVELRGGPASPQENGVLVEIFGAGRHLEPQIEDFAIRKTIRAIDQPFFPRAPVLRCRRSGKRPRTARTFYAIWRSTIGTGQFRWW